MCRECGSECGTGSSRPWALAGMLAGRHWGAGTSPPSLPAQTMALLSYCHMSGCGGPLPHPSLRKPMCYTVGGDKGEALEKAEPPPNTMPGTRPDLRSSEPPSHSSSAPPSDGSPQVEAGHSEVNTQNVLAGERLLAGCACHGRGALLLSQAGPAQEVATGKLVRRLPSEVGGEHSFAGCAFRAQAAPRLLW